MPVGSALAFDAVEPAAINRQRTGNRSFDLYRAEGAGRKDG
jgi:hypothetical protein